MPPAWERDLMYPTATTFKAWASNATVAELGEVLAICIDELRRRVGPVEYRETLKGVGVPLDEGAI